MQAIGDNSCEQLFGFEAKLFLLHERAHKYQPNSPVSQAMRG
jgi:hypothetical protein